MGPGQLTIELGTAQLVRHVGDVHKTELTWVEVFIALVQSHLVGDYLLQTDWQARHKHGGLSRGPTSRRALVTHVSTYTLAFLPALLAERLGKELAWTVPLIAVPHMIQDDGRLIAVYVKKVKGLEPTQGGAVVAAVDQTFHFVALLGTAALLARRSRSRRSTKAARAAPRRARLLKTHRLER